MTKLFYFYCFFVVVMCTVIFTQIINGLGNI